MSSSGEGISAALDDMEIENLVSLLQEDDTVFHELNKLDLPIIESQYGYVPGSNDVDMVDFHDALDFFSNDYGGNTQLTNNNNQINTSNLMTEMSNTIVYDSMFNPTLDYTSTVCMDPIYGDRPHPQLSENILSQLYCTDYNNTAIIPTHPRETIEPFSTSHTFETDLVVNQANVNHDHSYARKESIEHSPIILSNLSDTVSLEINTGKNSDTDEGSDTGYDTTTTSPASTRSSFSSPKKLSVSVQSGESPLPTQLMSSPLPVAIANAELSQLVQDPVKLIDERIKFFMSRQEVHLTEEEMETLRSEGLPIPTTLPLTKTEEKALKSVRRKIRNKVAAQESRKKKKEYMHCLEEQVQQCTKENRKLHKKVETLETDNKTLLQQLAHLQALVARANPILGRQVNIGTCLMVVVLCFGVLFGNLLPYRVSMATANDYSTSAVRSRSLLSMDATSKLTTWIDFYKALLPGYRDPAHYKPQSSNNDISTMFNTLWIHCSSNDSNTLYNTPPVIRA